MKKIAALLIVLTFVVPLLGGIPSAAANGGAEPYSLEQVLSDRTSNRCFVNITAAPGGGFFAVGYLISANSTSDSIITKYDSAGMVVWEKYFGEPGYNFFQDVTAVSDGVVVVGTSTAFDDLAQQNIEDAVIVKYNNMGDVVWKRYFRISSSSVDTFWGVAAVSDGIVTVGGTWSYNGLVSQGGDDALIVKYDNAGEVVWKKSFGGSDSECFRDVTAVSDGVVAVGMSVSSDGDMEGLANGNYSATIVKYDNMGEVVWKKSFGGSAYEYYYGVTAVSDGVVAVGMSDSTNGDMGGLANGDYSAIIVKYDNMGEVVWKKSFGGSGEEKYHGVTTVSDGVVAVGTSVSSDGDMEGLANGDYSAIIVKYDNAGRIVWKKSFGGTGYEQYNGVTAVSNGVVAVGFSDSTDGDLTGLNNIGEFDTGSLVVTYLTVGADYSAVDTAISEIPADLTIYTDESVRALINARNAIVRGKPITEQETVDGYAADIESAILRLVRSTEMPMQTPAQTTSAEIPHTGDRMNFPVLFGTMAISLLLTGYLLKRRKTNHNIRLKND